MATQIFTPEAIAAQSGFGTAPTPAILSAQDASWATASATNSATSLTADFSYPAASTSGATLTSGANLQTITVQARKNGGSGTPSFTIQVLENGTVITTSAANNVTSTTGSLYQFTWDASLLSDPSGAGVQVKVTTSTVGGSGSVRATVDYGYVDWTATYTAGVTLNGLFWSETSFNNGVMYGIVARNAAAGNRVGWLGQAKTAGSSITCSDNRFVVDANGTVLVATGAVFTAAEVAGLITATFTESLSGTTKNTVLSILVKDIALAPGALSPAWDVDDRWSKAYTTVQNATTVTGVAGMNSTFGHRVNVGYPGDTTAKLYIKHTMTGWQQNSGTQSDVIGFATSTHGIHRINADPGRGNTPASFAGSGISMSHSGALYFDGAVYNKGATLFLGANGAVGNVYEMAIDPKNQLIWVAYNGTWATQCGDPGAGGPGIPYLTPLVDIFAFYGPYNADTIVNNWNDVAPAGFQNYAAGLPQIGSTRKGPRTVFIY